MENVNRRGEKYFIYCGKTKAGNDKFFASQKSTSAAGEQADALPDDFEVFENPSNALVTVRRRKPTNITESERQFVQERADSLSDACAVQVVIEGNYLVIYEAERMSLSSNSLFGDRMDGLFARRLAEVSRDFSHRTAVMRFKLVDKTKQRYEVERYCFRGSIDGWISLYASGTLDKLSNKFLPVVAQLDRQQAQPAGLGQRFDRLF